MSSIIADLIEWYPDLRSCTGEIEAAFDLLKTSFESGGKLLICGNGGSASDSEHIAGELMKGFRSRRPISGNVADQLRAAFPEHGVYLAERLQGALPAIALVGQTALTTAITNDIAGDMIFAQQVYGYGQPNDVVLAISTSGNAANILHALRVAQVLGLRTVGLTGQSGGAMKHLCNVTICVPYTDTAQIQERHLPIYHALCAMLEERFFPNE